jgi:hypothetical protein
MRNTYGHAYVPHGIMRILPFWEYRYPITFAGISAVVAVWCVAVGGVLCVVGYPAWGLVAFAGAALRVWIARALVQYAQT